MKEKIYSTKEIAVLCSVHPNTVRLYEKWGFLSKVERAKNNYRIFTEKHLYQLRLARVALPGPYPIDDDIIYGLVKKFAAGDILGSLRLAKEYLSRVETEQEKAFLAMTVLDKWFENNPGPGNKNTIVYVTRKKAATGLGLTVDSLRTWERNGLYHISKDNQGKLQFTEGDIEKLMVIKLLRNSGYSIASLLNVFGNEPNPNEKPSTLLSLKNSESEINYFTDRYLEFLKGHIERAKKIIYLIENYTTDNTH